MISLYECTVPVLDHYLAQLDGLLERCGASSDRILEHRNTARTLSTAEHLGAAQGFAIRAVFPTIGQPTPPFETAEMHVEGLRQRNVQARTLLGSVTMADFDAARSITVEHQAGEAALRQSAADYVLSFAMPNFFFHFSMAYSIAQQAGLALGKQDFDGLHRYRPGFSFIPPAT